MDPATAFQIACGAFQLADLCCRTAQTGYEIYKSADGLTHDKSRTEQAAAHIASVAASVELRLDTFQTPDSAPLSLDQQRLKSTCEESVQCSTELRHLLDRIKSKKERGMRDVAMAMWRNKRAATEIDNLKQRSEEYRRRLDSDLLVDITKQLDFSNESQKRLVAQVDIALLRQTIAYRAFEQQFCDMFTQLSSLRDDFTHQQKDLRLAIHHNHSRNAQRKKAQDFIDKLSFPEIYTRETQIVGAYSTTFQWIFKPQNRLQKPWSDFVTFLQGDDSIYWISGQAGSGKSVLLKFVAQHDETSAHLQQWSSGKNVILAKFFFWSAGTKLEKSTTGMLRSLVLQILQKVPQVIDEAVSGNLHEYTLSNGLNFPTAWDAETLSRLLLRIIRLTASGYKVCLMLDGLDELEGDSNDQQVLIDCVKTLANVDNVKLVVSSRPEPHLGEAFYGCPNLRLQELNASDIREFTQGKLASYPDLEKVYNAGDFGDSSLLGFLIHKADGVFLWIALAVNDLARAVQRHDTPAQFRERLLSMDGNITHLFIRMLEDIDPVHRRRLALVLNVFIHHLNRAYHCYITDLGAAIDWPDLDDNGVFAIERTEQLLSDPTNLHTRLEHLVEMCLKQSAGLLDVTDSDPYFEHNDYYPCSEERIWAHYSKFVEEIVILAAAEWGLMTLVNNGFSKYDNDSRQALVQRTTFAAAFGLLGAHKLHPNPEEKLHTIMKLVDSGADPNAPIPKTFRFSLLDPRYIWRSLSYFLDFNIEHSLFDNLLSGLLFSFDYPSRGLGSAASVLACGKTLEAFVSRGADINHEVTYFFLDNDLKAPRHDQWRLRISSSVLFLLETIQKYGDHKDDMMDVINTARDQGARSTSRLLRVESRPDLSTADGYWKTWPCPDCHSELDEELGREFAQRYVSAKHTSADDAGYVNFKNFMLDLKARVECKHVLPAHYLDSVNNGT
ncbi:MAG: hypothetical protein Q9162_000528 [Coniocarpon cinnabarinum]